MRAIPLARQRCKSTPRDTSAERLANRIARLNLGRDGVRQLLAATYHRAARVRAHGVAITYWTRTVES